MMSVYSTQLAKCGAKGSVPPCYDRRVFGPQFNALIA